MKKFLAKITRGELQLLDRKLFIKEMNGMRDGDAVLTVRYAKEKDIRSILQNDYYWGCVLATLEESTGQGADYWHDFCKVQFILPLVTGKKINAIELTTEQITSIARHLTTTDLKTDEFEDYLRQIRMWASQQGIIIPEPERGRITKKRG